MAYAYNNLMGMMDKDKEQGPSSQSNAQSQNLQKNTGTGEGEMNASSNTAKAPQDFTKSNFTSAKQILDRNKNVQMVGAENRLTQDAQNQAQKGISDYNTAGNQYREGQQKKAESLYSTPQQSDVNRAIYGQDQTGYSNIQNTLNSKPGQVEEFKAPEIGPLQATEYSRVNDLSDLFMKQGGQQYNRGMAALDNLQFGKTGGAQRVNERVGQLQSQLDATKTSLFDKEQGVQAMAQNQLNSKAKETQDAIRKMLGVTQSEVEGGVNSRRDNLDQTVHSQAKQAADTATQGFQKQISTATQDIKNRMLSASPEERDALQNVLNQFGGLNAKRYVDQVLPNASFQNVINPEEAQRLNSINKLLGVDQTVTSTGGNLQGSANIRGDQFNTDFQKILSMLPPAQQAQAVAQVQAAQQPQAKVLGPAARSDGYSPNSANNYANATTNTYGKDKDNIQLPTGNYANATRNRYGRDN